MTPPSRQAKKPDDVLCRACHRDVIKAKYVHGPAALWYCLTCHDPEASPVRYQFTTADPLSAIKTTQPVEPAEYAPTRSSFCEALPIESDPPTPMT